MEMIDVLDSIQCHCHVMERTDTGQMPTSLNVCNKLRTDFGNEE